MKETSGTEPALGRIAQVAIPVENLERATAFYRDVLGFEHLFSAPPGLSFLRCGDIRLMLAAPEPGGAEGERGIVLYHVVEDPARAHARLEAGETDVVAEPHVVHRSGESELWMGFYRDTEGTLFATLCERTGQGGSA